MDDIEGINNKNNISIITLFGLLNLYKVIKLLMLIKEADQAIKLKNASGKNQIVLLFWFCNQFNCPNIPIRNKKIEIIELKNTINKKSFFILYKKFESFLIVSSSLSLYK